LHAHSSVSQLMLHPRKVFVPNCIEIQPIEAYSLLRKQNTNNIAIPCVNKRYIFHKQMGFHLREFSKAKIAINIQ